MAKKTLRESVKTHDFSMKHVALPLEEEWDGRTRDDRWREGHAGYTFRVWDGAQSIAAFDSFRQARSYARKQHLLTGRPLIVKDQDGRQYYRT